jgi:hypothetical protein
MAKANKSKTTAVAKSKKRNDVAINSGAPMGLIQAGLKMGHRGNEKVDSDCIAVQFLRIAQDNSDMVKKKSSSKIEGLEAGMFFNTSTQKIYGEAVKIIVLHFDRQYNIYELKDGKQGDFKGIITTEEMDELLRTKEAIQDGLEITNKDRTLKYADTRVFYVMLPDDMDTGILLFPLASSGIPHSKRIISILNSIVIPGDDSGESAPYYATVLELKTAFNEEEFSWYQIGTKKVTNCQVLGWVTDELAEKILKAIVNLKTMLKDSKRFDYSTMSDEPRNVTRDKNLKPGQEF